MQNNKWLVIESSGMGLADTKDTLSALPFLNNTQVAENYLSANAIISEFKPDILIADLGSVSIDQLKTLSDCRFPEIPVILISDKASDAVKAFDSGVPVDFVLKPLTVQRMTTAINRAIDQNLQANHAFSTFKYVESENVFKKVRSRDLVLT